MRASFSCIYVTSTVAPSYETALTPTLLTLGPQNPLFLKKTREVFQYLVMVLHSENLILCFILLGGHKIS